LKASLDKDPRLDWLTVWKTSKVLYFLAATSKVSHTKPILLMVALVSEVIYIKWQSALILVLIQKLKERIKLVAIVNNS